LRNLLELVTVAHVAAGEFPQDMLALMGGTTATEAQLADQHAGLRSPH
jgi:hypothetical protein